MRSIKKVGVIVVGIAGLGYLLFQGMAIVELPRFQGSERNEPVVFEANPVFSVNSILTSELKVDEIKSLETLIEWLRRFSKINTTPEELIESLRREGLRPIVVDKANSETGRQVTIRTEEALEGTRYIHAQFFEDEAGHPFMQHMSFEVRPSNDSMKFAIETAAKTFDLPTSQDDFGSDFKEWHRNGRTLWIKRLTDPEELQSNLYNARSSEDSGVVVVALEVNPHSSHVDHD